MQNTTSDEESQPTQAEFYKEIMDKLNDKDQTSKEIGKAMIDKMCLNRDPLFEPYLLQIMNSICTQEGFISNKNRNTREFFFPNND